MSKSPQRRDGKKVGKTLKEKREVKRTKQQAKRADRALISGRSAALIGKLLAKRGICLTT